jgi:predicted transcriptional regulator
MVFAAHSFSVMSDRELVLDAVQELPDNLSFRQIVDELLLLDEVKARLAKSERGVPGVPHEDVVKMLDSWITK